MSDIAHPAQIAVALTILEEFGLSPEEIRTLFAGKMAAVLMRLNTKGGDVSQYYRRILKDRQACLVEVACYLFNLRIPPNRNMPKVLVKRRMHCHYTLEKYLPEFVAECRRLFPEDDAFYAWASAEITALCRAFLKSNN